MKNKGFRTAIRITWLVIILCLIAIALMVKIYLIDNYMGHEWDYLVFSIPLIVPSIVFLLLLYNLKRAYEGGKKELEEAEAIVNWTYNEDEWFRFNLKEWKRSRNRAVAIPLGILILFFIAGMLDSGFSSEGLRMAAPYVIIFFGLLSLIMFFYTYALYRRTATCPREVIVGQYGFLYGGYYNSWKLFGTYLAGVKLIPGEITIMEFNIMVLGKGGYSSHPLRIPVPKGKEQEAERVIRELNSPQEKQAGSEKSRN